MRSSKTAGISTTLAALFRHLGRYLQIPSQQDFDLAYVAGASDRIDLEMRIRERDRASRTIAADRLYTWRM